MKYWMIAILSPGLATAAYSDEVLLTNGHKLLGIAREEPGRVIVEMNFGTVSIPREEVKAIVPGRTLLHEYGEYASVLGSCPDAVSTFELALWAQDHGLTRYVDDLLHRTIDLDPEHAQARQRLGHVCFQGKWMTGFELKKSLGWGEVQGLWVAPKDPDSFCTVDDPSCVVLRTGRRIADARRKHAAPEGVSYSLGFPAYSSRGTRNYGYGGYSVWGGVVAIHNLWDLPVIKNKSR